MGVQSGTPSPKKIRKVPKEQKKDSSGQVSPNRSGVRKRSFRKGVLGGTCLVFPDTCLFASETEKEHPRELPDETPFPNALGGVTKGVCMG